jgi:hypothetical protein
MFPKKIFGLRILREASRAVYWRESLRGLFKLAQLSGDKFLNWPNYVVISLIYPFNF